MENSVTENRITKYIQGEYRNEIEAGIEAGFTYEQSKSMALDFIKKKYEIEDDLSVTEQSTLGGTMKWYKKPLEKKAEQIALKNSAGTKVCTKCGQRKPYVEFWANKTTKDGFQYWCKDCMNKTEKKPHITDKEHATPLFGDKKVIVQEITLTMDNVQLKCINDDMQFYPVNYGYFTLEDLADAVDLLNIAKQKLSNKQEQTCTKK